MHELLRLVLAQLRGAWRFRWLALGIAWMAAMVGWLYVYSMPNLYKVEARVHIDTESAIQNLLGDMAATPDAERQVAILIETIQSRPNLKKIARRTGLALEVTSTKERQAMLARLEQKIKIHGSRRTDLYHIAYTGTQPERAHAVVQQVIRVMTRMVGKVAGSPTSRATNFIQREVNVFEAQLEQAHRKLLAFKKKHPDIVASEGPYSSRLNQLRTKVARLESKITMARNRRQALAGNSGSTTVPPAQTQQVRKLDARINNLEQRINGLLTRYTPQHPEVISAQNRLARLKEQRSELIAKLRANPQLRKAPGSGVAGNSLALKQIRLRINTLQAQISSTRAQIEKLQANANQISAAQATLERLQRNYRVAKKQYQNILGRLYAARLSSDVQASSNPLEFRVVDPPVVPAEPSGPRRLMLITIALIASLLAGAGFAFFMSQIRPVFLNRQALAEGTGLPVLGAISLAAKPMQKARRRTASFIFLCCSATLLVGYAGALWLAPIAVGLVPSLL